MVSGWGRKRGGLAAWVCGIAGRNVPGIGLGPCFRPLPPGTLSPSLKLTRPPCFHDSSGDDYRRRVRKAVALRLERLTRARTTSVLGAAAVLAQSPFEQPHATPPSRTLNPRLAHRGQDKWRRIELLQALASFRQS